MRFHIERLAAGTGTHISDQPATFQQRLWTDFTVQRPEPGDPTLRYGGVGHSESKLRHFTGTPFYQALLPETQNILHHVWQND